MAGAPGNAENANNLTSSAIISRLPTFKGPRDLTLSAIARSRRQYVPNIPPKRDRSDPAATTTTQTSKPQQKQFAQPLLPGPSELKSKKPRPKVPPGFGLHDRRGGGGRGRGERPELVQSTSIFSEGVGVKSVTSKRTSSGGRGRGRGRGGSSSASSSRQPISTAELEDVLRPKQKSVRSEDDDVEIEDDDDEDTIGGMGTFIEGLDQGPLPHNLRPVALPLGAHRKKSKKASPGDPFSEYLKSTPKGTLACLQMPYILPFIRENEEPTTDQKTYVKNLSDVKGGCIGKIQVRKSGKCFLVLGKSEKDQISFEVEPSKRISFRQELMAINTQKKSMTVLGKVQHKFVCSPDLSPLFDDRCNFVS